MAETYGKIKGPVAEVKLQGILTMRTGPAIN